MDFGEHCLKVEETKFECLLFGVKASMIDDICNILYTNHHGWPEGHSAIGYEFNYDEYHRYVHGTLPYHKIKKDAVLKKILGNTRIRKIAEL